MKAIPYGKAEPRPGSDNWLLRYELQLAHPLDHVWAAVATPAGLGQWLAVPEPWEPKLGGATTFTWQNGDEKGGPPTVDEGRITAWDPGRVAEYTLALHGRARFHLEANGPGGTVLRFTNEVRDIGEEERNSRLAGWHNHLELLGAALDGEPYDWSGWTLTRYRELLGEYGGQG
ncbi:SRPBCC domain-containing protein [Streptomyces sp. NPDC051561]|uniref:SRPBCC domain-containing protein n=1 Tax=Streptomyces sp. NPDC051561 TaxID=3365658 RepID=UPI0037A53EE7